MKSKTTKTLISFPIKENQSEEICLTPEMYICNTNNRIEMISWRKKKESLPPLCDTMTRDSMKLTVISLEGLIKWESNKKDDTVDEDDEIDNYSDVSDFDLDTYKNKYDGEDSQHEDDYGNANVNDSGNDNGDS